MIVDCALYRHGVRESADRDLGQALAAARARGDSFIWIGLHDPTQEELDQVAAEFALHPLAVEDAVNAQQRPKIEEFEDSLFMVLKTVRYDEATQQIELGDVMLFLGDSFVVTVRHGQARALKDIRRRLEHERRLLDCGPSAVLYAVCDAVVDDYSVIALAVEDDIEEVEERVFAPRSGQDAERIHNLKREVIEFRRAVRPLVEPVERLAAGLIPFVHEHLRPFFRDVADHTVRAADQIDGFDDLLSSVLSANLAQVGIQQNADMRRISAWVAIAAVPTAIAGIYGMNFANMPELTWRYGYPATMLVITVICVVLYRAFRRSGWL
ncbi:MAG TPA: magnesium/cobalt transporter CorA [Actinomycetes bacterium]|nr:magnesium/cobalt transporter CorA [Actinomycetes bacterium]